MVTCSQTLRVGMPHLDIFGLSEWFCLSNAGSNHWSLISELTSKKPTQWRGGQGERIYASFVYASVSYFRRFSVDEDDTVRIECNLRGLRAPFVISETDYIKSDSDIVATVKLMSTFSTTNGQSNKRFVKSTMDLHSEPFGEPIFDSTRNRYKEIYRYDDRDLKETQEHIVNPSVDFNAANFMYFVNYCQLFKRYESSEAGSMAPPTFREIAYFGNVDPFERITVYSRRKNLQVISAMKRSSDQKCIARSFSVNASNGSQASEVVPALRDRISVDTDSCHPLEANP